MSWFSLGLVTPCSQLIHILLLVSQTWLAVQSEPFLQTIPRTFEVLKLYLMVARKKDKIYLELEYICLGSH